MFDSMDSGKGQLAEMLRNLNQSPTNEFAWNRDDTEYIGRSWPMFLNARYGSPSWTVVVSMTHSDAFAPLVRFTRLLPQVSLLCLSIVVLLMLSIALMYQPSTRPEAAEFSNNIHNAFATIVDYTPRFILGSLLAYYVSQSFDVWAFHRIRQITGERWLWLRNNLSTLSSQVIDTLIFSLVVWWGPLSLNQALMLGVAKYGFKVIIAAVDTVFLYWARAAFRKRHPEIGSASAV